MLRAGRFPARPASIAASALALFDLLFLFAMRCAWSGIAEATGILDSILLGLSLLFLAAAASQALLAFLLFAYPKTALARSAAFKAAFLSSAALLLVALALDIGDELIVARNTDLRRNAIRVVAPWSGEDLGEAIGILPHSRRK
jgi:hypothetical protein